MTMTDKPGGRWVIGSLACAALSLGVAPVVFGPLGVVAGCVAAWKGAKWWASAAVSASFVAKHSKTNEVIAGLSRASAARW